MTLRSAVSLAFVAHLLVVAGCSDMEFVSSTSERPQQEVDAFVAALQAKGVAAEVKAFKYECGIDCHLQAVLQLKGGSDVVGKVYKGPAAPDCPSLTLVPTPFASCDDVVAHHKSAPGRSWTAYSRTSEHSAASSTVVLVWFEM